MRWDRERNDDARPPVASRTPPTSVGDRRLAGGHRFDQRVGETFGDAREENHVAGVIRVEHRFDVTLEGHESRG